MKGHSLNIPSNPKKDNLPMQAGTSNNTTTIKRNKENAQIKNKKTKNTKQHERANPRTTNASPAKVGQSNLGPLPFYLLFSFLALPCLPVQSVVLSAINAHNTPPWRSTPDRTRTVAQPAPQGAPRVIYIYHFVTKRDWEQATA